MCIRDRFGTYQGPETLSEIDPGLAETEANLTTQGRDLQTGARGTLQDKLASEGTYSTGARNLDTALVGQQSQGIQQTGRASAGVGGQATLTDQNIRDLSTERRTNLEALPGQAAQDVQADFATQQALQQEGYQNIVDKIQSTKVDTEKINKVVNDAKADYDRKLTALNGLENEMNDFAYNCLLYTSPSPRDRQKSRMPSSA